MEITVELYRGLLTHGQGFGGAELATESEPLFDIFPFESELFITLAGLEESNPLYQFKVVGGLEAEPFQPLVRYFAPFSSILDGSEGKEIVPFKVFWDPNTDELSIDPPYSYREGSYIRGVIFEESDELVIPGSFIWGDKLDKGRVQRLEQTLIGSSFETFVTADGQVEHQYPTFLITHLYGRFRRVKFWEDWGIVEHYQIRDIPYLQTSRNEREAARIRRENHLPEY